MLYCQEQGFAPCSGCRKIRILTKWVSRHGEKKPRHTRRCATFGDDGREQGKLLTDLRSVTTCTLLAWLLLLLLAALYQIAH